jgi:murein L,D-transpeptidase YafK
MKVSSILFLVSLCVSGVFGQTSVSNFTFIDYQRSFPRINEALKRKQDTLMGQFREKKLPWPAPYIFLRSFKYDSQLEVWVKYKKNEQFRHFKTYKVCALAGTLGPKRMQGDFQVPEGFYYINEFNPKSAYHLSLGLNYPNASDRILSDSLQPGGDIYIHGSCVTTGCIPIMDQQIEELYILAAHAKNSGQDFIPVHIYPIHFKNPKSKEYLARYLRDFPEYGSMARELREAYDFFEKTKKLPLVLVNTAGRYVIQSPLSIKEEESMAPKKRIRRPVKHFDESQLAKVVDKLPVFPGGNEGFQKFIDNTSNEVRSLLSDAQQKTYVLIEFIIDKEGVPAYAKVLQGGNEDMNDVLQEKFENMPAWTPATRGGKNVPIKLKQSIVVEK